MHTIHKYNLYPIDPENAIGFKTLNIHKGFTVLSVGVQGNEPFVWCLVNVERSLIKVRFLRAYEGSYFPAGKWKCLGRLDYRNGTVEHVFVDQGVF